MAETAPSARPDGERARLVLVVIIDQLPSWAFEKYLSLLPENGALRSGIAKGTFHRRAVLPYAATYTAPGHAAVHTGQPPAFSGIAVNDAWSSERRAEISILADERYPVFGNPRSSASPGALRAPTVGDQLKVTTSGRGKIVSLSLKDRAAVLSGGQKADAAVWYDPEIPGFTSSRYYASTLPGWLAHWQRTHPLRDRLAPWHPLNAELLARAAGADDAPGEGDWLGLGRIFPHAPSSTTHPYRALRASPALNDALLELAEHSVDVFDLGTDGAQDLLLLSISTLDYVGHIFGQDSWEYLDTLLRVDRSLTALIAGLEQRTTLAVLVTSDHGAAPLPERSREAGRMSGRIFPEELLLEADRAVDRSLGPGDWVEAFSEPFLYLSAGSKARRLEVVPVIERALTALESVHAVYDNQKLLMLRKQPSSERTSDDTTRAVALSVSDAAADCLYVVPERWFIVDPDVARGFGTSHGSPWAYDREVPVVAWGSGLPRIETSAPIDQGRVAQLIARLLQVPWPTPESRGQ